MKNEKCEKIVLMVNGTLARKLKSISQDLKTYININVIEPGIEDDKIKYMSEEDIEELLDIRVRIKRLARKLEEYGYGKK